MNLKKTVSKCAEWMLFGIAILFAADWLLSGLWTMLTKQCPAVIAWAREYNWQPIRIFVRQYWPWIAGITVGAVIAYRQGTLAGKIEEAEKRFKREEQ